MKNIEKVEIDKEKELGSYEEIRLLELLGMTVEYAAKFNNRSQCVRDTTKKVKNEVESLRNSNYNLITRRNKHFPERFDSLGCYIFYEGDINVLLDEEKIKLGVVGSRDCEDNAIFNTKDYCEKLALKGHTVVSGLALGIDAASFEGALKGKGKTIAVLPCPLDKITPKTNENLLKRAISHGGLAITKSLPGGNIGKHHFVERNKLIADISNYIIIGDSNVKGGTVHTLNFAKAIDKDIYYIETPKKLLTLDDEKRSFFTSKYKCTFIKK